MSKRLIKVTIQALVDMYDFNELNEDIVEDLRCSEFLHDFDRVDVEDLGEYKDE